MTTKPGERRGSGVAGGLPGKDRLVSKGGGSRVFEGSLIKSFSVVRSKQGS